uniref:Uncharacterized protein n=1 Tax=viral metagenome TaxID=1070528 RepID=A0A6C0IFC0_9ZZZZ
MNNRCEILDDNEIELQEKNRSIFNFRRFDASDLEKRSSPFDKLEKKEFPFLFQKKPKRFTEDKMISLDELSSKLESIRFLNNKNEYKSLTPPWNPFLYNDDLKVTCEIEEEEKEKEKKQEETDGTK